MHQLFSRVIVTSMLALASCPTWAGGNVTSRISEVGAMPSKEVAWIKMVGPVSGQASCADANAFALDVGTPAGAQLYKTILAAQIQNLPLTVRGSGACRQLSGYEDIYYVRFKPPTE